jgi:hypothetical protein
MEVWELGKHPYVMLSGIFLMCLIFVVPVMALSILSRELEM